MTGRLTRAFTTSAKQVSVLVALVLVGAVVGLLGLALGTQFPALVGLLLAVAAAGALAASLLVSERQQDERLDEEVERLSTEHARLSDQLITAEQEERRRLALNGPRRNRVVFEHPARR